MSIKKKDSETRNRVKFGKNFKREFGNGLIHIFAEIPLGAARVMWLQTDKGFLRLHFPKEGPVEIARFKDEKHLIVNLRDVLQGAA